MYSPKNLNTLLLTYLKLAVLMLGSHSAVAAGNWSYFASVMKEHHIYLDHSRFERGEKPTIWVLYDSKDPDEDGSRSVTQKFEADCTIDQVRTLEFAYFVGNMATGKQIRKSAKPGEWSEPKSGSSMERVLNFMCGRLVRQDLAVNLNAGLEAHESPLFRF